MPAGWIVWDALHDNLGANPIEAITHRTGDWTIRLLLASLAVTPLRRLTGWNGLIRYRRTIGLLAFTYVCLHFLTYVVLDQGFPLQGFAIAYVVEDIAKRPYITVGFTAFLLLIPIAWTSTKGWIRRLGRRWTTLHQLVYVAAALGVLHYLWLIKGDRPTAVYYGLILVGLLVARVWHLRRVASPRPAPTPAAPVTALVSSAPEAR
ncbi:MAG: sulfite oxidase heme-binding subunit YedZ [Candidatus Methylomirabilaceae bacterium]